MWVSTWWRRPDEAPAEFVARLGAAGVEGIALHDGLGPALADELIRACLSSGTRVAAVAAPFPRGAGRRSPYLATSDREERLAAVTEALATIGAAVSLGAPVVIVALGTLPVRAEWKELTLAFARGDDISPRVERARRLRRELSPHALDLVRFGLERVLPRAADAGVRLAVTNRARWYEIPQGTELSHLMTEHAGSPLAAWIDPAAAHVRQTLEFPTYEPPPPDRCAGAWLSDAAGLRGGLPWGRGEADPALIAPATLRIHHVPPDVQLDELYGS